MSKIFLNDQAAAPDRIRFIPMGVSYVNATMDDEPSYVTLEVTPDDIITLNADLQESIKAAQENRQVFPFIDFNHENEEASAHPVSFELSEDGEYIEMIVEWTESGKKAVEAKEYLYFSPTLLLENNLEDEVHKLYGITTNVGGLTNSPAFVRQKRLMAASKPTLPYIQIREKRQVEKTTADTVESTAATPMPEPPAKHPDIVKLEAELPEAAPDPVIIVEAPKPEPAAPTQAELLRAKLAEIKSDKERCDFIVRNWSKFK